MATIATVEHSGLEIDALTDAQLEDTALDRAELTARLARAANDEAQYLLKEAERLSLVVQSAKARHHSAWMIR